MSLINSYACDKKCPDELLFSNQSKSGNIAAPNNGESNEIWRDENI